MVGRRALLAGALVAVGGGVWAIAGANTTDEIAALGELYLAGLPARPEASALAVELFGSLDHARSMADDTDALRGWLSKRQRSDFAEGRTVDVGGCVLSQTEAKMAAWVALS